MIPVYYIAISRDEDREFLYSTEIMSQKLSDEEYKELKLDSENVVFYLDATENQIIAVSSLKECVEGFLTGVSWERYKEEEWDDMFDNYIDDQINE